MVQKTSALPTCKGEVTRFDLTWDLVDRYGAPPAPLRLRIEALPWPKATEEFFTRLKLWCPAIVRNSAV